MKRKCGQNAYRKSSQEKWIEAVGLCLLHAARADLLSLSQGKACRFCNNDHQLESRMRENRLSGLEGGVAFGPSLPLSIPRQGARPLGRFSVPPPKASKTMLVALSNRTAKRPKGRAPTSRRGARPLRPLQRPSA